MNTLHPCSVRRPGLKLAATCLLLPVLSAGWLTSATARDVAPRAGRVVEPALPLKKIDRDFMEKAAKSTLNDVAISRVAAARTSNPEVRRFAQSMIEDHERAIDALGTLAVSRGVSLPAKDAYPEKWEKRDAKDFDEDYLEQMVSDHEDAVKLFEKEAKDGIDTDTVAYARKYLPKMQGHLQHAVDLQRALKETRARR